MVTTALTGANDMARRIKQVRGTPEEEAAIASISAATARKNEEVHQALYRRQERKNKEIYGPGIGGWLNRVLAENRRSLVYAVVFTGIGVLMLQCSKYVSGY